MPRTKEQDATRQRRYHHRNRDKVLPKMRERNAAYYEHNSEWLRQQKMWSPCLDCGGTFPPEAMDYDHVRGEPKVNHVGSLVRGGPGAIKTMQDEIAKCDLVCSNCHRARTAHRRQLASRA